MRSSSADGCDLRGDTASAKTMWIESVIMQMLNLHFHTRVFDPNLNP